VREVHRLADQIATLVGEAEMTRPRVAGTGGVRG
jgi:hypothetical protein